MSLSRRELLTLLLGAPLALEACKKTRPPVAGTIRGAAMSVGHKLRETPSVERASGPLRKVDVAIVGSGPSGLGAAWRLERLGERNFVVLELEPQPGGTSTYGSDGVVPYPWGAHYVPVPRRGNRALVALLEELGAIERGPAGEPQGKEGILIREPEERLFVGDRWYEGLFPEAGASAADLAELERFNQLVGKWAGFRDAAGRRAFTLPLAHCSDAAELVELDRISAAQLLERHGFVSPRLRWFVEYACRDDYGLSLADTSAWAMLFYFAARLSGPGGTSAPFLAWPEGNGRVVRHLASIAAERLETGRLVTDVVVRDDGVELAVLDAATGTLSRYQADRVILAVPKFVARRILRAWRETAPDFVSAFGYGSWMVANLHLKRRPKSAGFPLAWDNVIYDSAALGYVVATHQRAVDRGPTIFTYYHPFTDTDPTLGRKKLAAIDHAGFCDAILTDLGRAHDDLERVVERIDVWRWGHAMVRPTPGFIWGPARRRAALPYGRVHFAHSDLSGLALLEEALDHGVRAAEEVAMARGRPIESLRG